MIYIINDISQVFLVGVDQVKHNILKVKREKFFFAEILGMKTRAAREIKYKPIKFYISFAVMFKTTFIQLTLNIAKFKN